MRFVARWTPEAASRFEALRREAERMARVRAAKRSSRSSKAEGLFRQVEKAITLLIANPRHPGLRTHEFHSIDNPYDPRAKVYEAYAQHHTPGAHRVFWCYGPSSGEITILAITPHP